MNRLHNHVMRLWWRTLSRRSQNRNYLDAVAPAVQGIEAATVQVQAPRGSTHLRLSVTPTLFSHWLIPRLPDFRQRHPDITLSFAPYQRDDALDASDIDAWLRGGDGHWPQHIAADYVVGRELVPICRPAELQGPQAIREPQDLLRPISSGSPCWCRP